MLSLLFSGPHASPESTTPGSDRPGATILWLRDACGPIDPYLYMLARHHNVQIIQVRTTDEAVQWRRQHFAHALVVETDLSQAQARTLLAAMRRPDMKTDATALVAMLPRSPRNIVVARRAGFDACGSWLEVLTLISSMLRKFGPAHADSDQA